MHVDFYKMRVDRSYCSAKTIFIELVSSLIRHAQFHNNHSTDSRILTDCHYRIYQQFAIYWHKNRSTSGLFRPCAKTTNAFCTCRNDRDISSNAKYKNCLDNVMRRLMIVFIQNHEASTEMKISRKIIQSIKSHCCSLSLLKRI